MGLVLRARGSPPDPPGRAAAAAGGPQQVPGPGRGLRGLAVRAALGALENLLQFLPWRAVLMVGGGIGALMYILQPRRRRRARQNLALALGDRHGRRELRRIERRVFWSLGRNLAEICWVAARPERSDRLVTFQGLEHMKAARARGRGVVLLAGHLGSWELMAAAMVRQGIPLAVIARRTSDGQAGRLVLGLRERLGVQTVLRGSSRAARSVLRALRSGGVLGSLIDQDIRVAGVVVDFFGRPALTPTGPISLALRAGAPVVHGVTWRLPDGTHQVRFEPPVDLERARGRDAARIIEEHAAAFTRWLEERIRERPEQWVWIHRRWRRGARRLAARLARERDVPGKD